jgi:hypothetical protein
MTRHIDAETLARFRQGDLSQRRDARIRAHLAGCSRCSNVNEGLAGVTSLLAAAAPPPIPEHLTARIQTALATEAARRAAATPGTAGTGAEAFAGPGGPELTPDGRSPRPERAGRGQGPRRLPGLASPVALRAMAATAAAVVIGGGAYGITQLAGGGASSSSAPGSGAGAPAAAPAHGPANGAGGAASRSSAAPPLVRYQHAGHQATVLAVRTNTDFTAATLKSQVSSEIARSGTLRAAPNANASSGSAGATAGPPLAAEPTSTLDGCVNRIAAGQQVLLVDVARYRGSPATVIVTSASAAGPELAWVVGTGCSAARSDVLDRTTLP